MLSSVFVDRPRLAIVIAIVTTIAGALALSVIPVSQFPNIVPPQVQVTARYPGHRRPAAGIGGEWGGSCALYAQQFGQ